MTMGPMQAIALVVKKYGGIDPNDEQAAEYFLEVVAPTLRPRIREAIFEEFFFLTTGLSWEYYTRLPKSKRRKKMVKPKSRR